METPYLYCWSAVHSQAAGDTDRLTGHEGRIVTRQECDEPGIIRGLANATQRYTPHHGIAYLLPLFAGADKCVHRRRISRTGTQAVEQHVVAGYLAGQRLRERDRGAFAARIYNFTGR